MKSNDHLVIEDDYQEALARYQSALKDLTRTHLIELKNQRLGPQKQLASELIAYLLRLLKPGKEPTKEEVLEVISTEGAKRVVA